MDHKEGRALKHWWFQTVVLEKTLESPLDCKKIKPVNPKGNQSWIFIGRTGAEVEVPVFWPPDAKSQMTLMLRTTEGRKEQRETGDEMVGWHHRFNRHELEQTLGDGVGLQRVEHDLATEQQQQQSREMKLHIYILMGQCQDLDMGKFWLFLSMTSNNLLDWFLIQLIFGLAQYSYSQRLVIISSTKFGPICSIL